jgi:bifunctional aspartokinase / homoserine dehydrogenase 1
MPIASKRQQRFTHVMKLGGSTVGRAASLSRALEIVAREATAAPIALVVSAFGDTTDELVAAYEEATRGDLDAPRARVEKIATVALEAAGGALAVRGLRSTGLSTLVQEELAPLRAALGQLSRTREGSAKLRDEVLAHGELLSAAVVAHVLSHAGLPALRVDARTWLTTDDRFGDASALEPETSTNVAQKSEEWLGEGRPITVHTGFLGRTTRGETTTLGRNGSDYSAALLAEAIGAKELTVLTDVPGVMTADPAIVPEAYTVPRLTYHEALELAGLGLRMLHPRTVLPLAKAGIPMTIVDTMRPVATGTRVDEEGDSNERRPTCIASLEGMTLLDVEATRETGGKNVAALALGILAAAAIDVWLTALAAHGQGVALVVRAEVAERAAAALDGALGEIATTRSVEKVAIVTLVAEAMGRTPNVAGRFFAAIGASGICVRASSQGASSRAISCVVDEADLHPAVRAVHAVMNLAPERMHLLVLGKGTVGSQVLAQLEATREARLATHDVDLRLVGLADRRVSVFDERTFSPSHAREALLSKVGASTVPADVLPLLDRLAHLPSAVLVDCTAADGMADVYTAAFARGIHVVTANKKPLTGPSRERSTLFEAARKAHRSLRYETTVGASLPVVETLRNLVRTGDRVFRIEGSLSGTLGYLSCEVTKGAKLSSAVREAHARGYTEPHPREDLAGLDVARKALILARELGLVMDLADITVVPFVPSHLLDHDDLPSFFAALEGHDEAFDERIREHRRGGRSLRYLATIERSWEGQGERAKVTVGPSFVGEDHPAARLRGAGAQITFTTERYADHPLVVQGSGAGGAVTAAGVLADVLALSHARRGGH